MVGSVGSAACNVARGASSKAAIVLRKMNRFMRLLISIPIE